MHYHIASTEQVVQMFSEDVISSIKSSAASASTVNVDASSQDMVIDASLLTNTTASVSLVSSSSSGVVGLSSKIAEAAAHLIAVKNEAETRKRRVDDMLRAEEQEALRAAREEARRLAECTVNLEAKRWANKTLVRNFITDSQRIAPDMYPIIQNPPFDSKQPPSLPECDDRFNRLKRKRIYACDTCHNIVGFSSWTHSTSKRAHGEFQGSYFDNSWARSIPGELLMRAYTEKLIDCTWHCSQFCGAAPTGVKDRTTRPMLWRDKQHGSGSKSSRAW
jgi:hypothetical protein